MPGKKTCARFNREMATLEASNEEFFQSSDGKRTSLFILSVGSKSSYYAFWAETSRVFGAFLLKIKQPDRSCKPSGTFTVA